MTISVFSVIMSIACSSVILFAASFLVAHAKRVRWGLLIMIFILGFVRLAVPVELRMAKEVFDWQFYPALQKLASRKVFLGISVAGMLGLIWLAGILKLLVAYIKRLLRLKKIILRAEPIDQVERLHDIFEEAVAGLGYRGNVKIAVSEAYPSPVSVGFFHPIILLPRATLDLSETELRFVIRHELTHYLRGDIGKDRALEVLQCIFWWNPIVYYLRRSVVEMLELECDERVCRGMSEEEQLVYFEAIHHVLKFSPRRGLGLGMSFASRRNGEFLTRRFQEILKPVPKYSRIVTGFLAVISITLFCLSYSFILQTAYAPVEYDQDQLDFGREQEQMAESYDFLIKISDGSYLYVVNMVGKEIITEEDIANNSLYAGLPIYEKKTEGREK